MKVCHSRPSFASSDVCLRKRSCSRSQGKSVNIVPQVDFSLYIFRIHTWVICFVVRQRDTAPQRDRISLVVHTCRSFSRVETTLKTRARLYHGKIRRNYRWFFSTRLKIQKSACRSGITHSKHNRDRIYDRIKKLQIFLLGSRITYTHA